MEKLTKKQQEVYNYFLSYFPLATDRFRFYGYGHSRNSEAISFSVLNALVKKGFLVNMNPKVSAYDRLLYVAIPQDEALKSLPLKVGTVFKYFDKSFEIMAINHRKEQIQLIVTYPTGYRGSETWKLKHTVWGIPEDLKPQDSSTGQETTN